jgi:DNA-binding phage protein
VKDTQPKVNSAKKETRGPSNIQSDSFDDALLDEALNEDDSEALLASALSDDIPEALLSGTMSEESRPVSDAESAQTNSLVDELVETHQSFLSAVLGMVQVSKGEEGLVLLGIEYSNFYFFSSLG